MTTEKTVRLPPSPMLASALLPKAWQKPEPSPPQKKATTLPPSLVNNGIENDFEDRCQHLFSQAGSAADFTSKIADILEQLGFTSFAFAALPPKPHIHFTNLPEAFLLAYGQENFIKNDYALRYAGYIPIFRSVIEDYMTAAPVKTCDMAKNRTLSDLYKGYGFYDSFLIPISDDISRYLFCVTTQTKNIDNFHANITAHMPTLSLLGKLILRWADRKEVFTEAAISPPLRLTPRPLRVLEALASDLTLMQAADKLCISIHTADKHIAAAKKALGAKTIHGAIYNAIQVGLFDGKKINQE